MSVLRRVHTNNFTIIGNAMLNDEGLSAEAVGVICYLIGKPHNWVLQPGQLSARFDCGADRIQRILKELIDARYIRKVRQRDPVTQQWQPVEYIVLDTRDEPLPENTLVATSEEPQLENPSLAFPVLQKKDSTKTESNKSPRRKSGAKRKAVQYTAEFETGIWQPYPRKTNTSKVNAFKKWTALSEEDQTLLRSAIPAFALAKRGTEEQFIPHLEFFISRRIFETVTVLHATSESNAPAILDRQTWENLGKIYASSNNWMRDWGPEPGRPGCKMPPDLQKQFVNTGLTSH